MADRIIHIADIHQGKNQYGLRVRGDDYHRAFVATLEQAQPGDIVLIAGDLFDSRDPGPFTYARTKRALEEAKGRSVQIMAVEGNHDRLLYDDVGRTWMHVLHDEGALQVLGRDGSPEIINLDGVRIVGIPYRGHREQEALEEVRSFLEVAALADPAPTILLCHIGVVEVGPNFGGVTKAEDFEPLRPYVDYVATGHFHKTWDNGFVYCPGPLEPTSISDDQGGYYQLSLVGTFDGPEFVTKFVPLESYHTPRRIIKNQRVGSLDELREKDWEGAIVQIIYTGTDLPSLEQMQDALAGHPPLKILPSYDVRALEHSEGNETRELGEIERQVLTDLLGETDVPIAQQLKRYALDGEDPEVIAQYAMEVTCQRNKTG